MFGKKQHGLSICCGVVEVVWCTRDRYPLTSFFFFFMGSLAALHISCSPLWVHPPSSFPSFPSFSWCTVESYSLSLSLSLGHLTVSASCPSGPSSLRRGRIVVEHFISASSANDLFLLARRSTSATLFFCGHSSQRHAVVVCEKKEQRNLHCLSRCNRVFPAFCLSASLADDPFACRIRVKMR